MSPSAAQMYNVVVSLGFLAYLGWRATSTKNVFRIWGMRSDNFWTALHFQLRFGAVAVFLIFGFGLLVGSVSLPMTFWLTLGLYPVWGIAQQFALQNLIAKNLNGFLSHPVAVACASAMLFGMAHYPRGVLVLATILAGFFFTLIYQRFPNLWASRVRSSRRGSSRCAGTRRHPDGIRRSPAGVPAALPGNRTPTVHPRGHGRSMPQARFAGSGRGSSMERWAGHVLRARPENARCGRGPVGSSNVAFPGCRAAHRGRTGSLGGPVAGVPRAHLRPPSRYRSPTGRCW